MSRNNKTLALLAAGLAIAAIAASPTFFQSDTTTEDEIGPAKTSAEAAERYRALRLAMEKKRAGEIANLVNEVELARQTSDPDETDTTSTDGKYTSSFKRLTDQASDEGFLSAVFVQDSGNCQLQIESVRGEIALNGRSVGCSGTSNTETGRLELSGQVVTDLGSSLPFSILGSVIDGRLAGTLFFEGESIELQP